MKRPESTKKLFGLPVDVYIDASTRFLGFLCLVPSHDAVPMIRLSRLTFQSEVFTTTQQFNMAVLLLLLCCVAYFLFTVIFIVLPAVLGGSFGIRNIYVKLLLRVFEVTPALLMIYLWLCWTIKRKSVVNYSRWSRCQKNLLLKFSLKI